MTYKYRYEVKTTGLPEEIEKWLNNLGEQGFKLIFTDFTNYVFINEMS